MKSNTQSVFVYLRQGRQGLCTWEFSDLLSSIHERTIVAVLQFKHLILETPGLDIIKMWSTIFVSSKLTEILQNLYKGIESLQQTQIFLPL